VECTPCWWAIWQLIPLVHNAGSLASSLLDPSVCLVGASGGVYSLLAGHMAHLLLNYSAVQCGPPRIIALIAVASIEVILTKHFLSILGENAKTLIFKDFVNFALFNVLQVGVAVYGRYSETEQVCDNFVAKQFASQNGQNLLLS